MEARYDLSDLLESLDKKYPSLGKDGPAKMLGVWHVFSSPDFRPGGFPLDPNLHICNVCGLAVTEEEVKVAHRQLFDLAERYKDVQVTWPAPLFRALENRLEPLICKERIPQFMEEVAYREGIDEPFDEGATGVEGLVLYGSVCEETFRRKDAYGLVPGEERMDLSDGEFYAWFWSLNTETDWTKRAYAVLKWVRERDRKPKQKKTKFVYEGGLMKEVEDDEDSAAEEDDELCESCGCFKPCDCEAADEGEDDLCETCGCFKPCDCP